MCEVFNTRFKGYYSNATIVLLNAIKPFAQTWIIIHLDLCSYMILFLSFYIVGMFSRLMTQLGKRSKPE